MLKYKYFIVITDYYFQPVGEIEEAYFTDEEAREKLDAGVILCKSQEEAEARATA